MEKCPVCPGTLKEAKIRLSITGVDIGSFDGSKCDRCGIEFLNEKSDLEAERIAKEKGLFGFKAPKGKAPCKVPIKHSH